MAAELVEAGHVRLNRAKVTKPGHILRPDDVLTIAVRRPCPRPEGEGRWAPGADPLPKHASYTKT